MIHVVSYGHPALTLVYFDPHCPYSSVAPTVHLATGITSGELFPTLNVAAPYSVISKTRAAILAG
jgi:hypothetical protein